MFKYKILLNEQNVIRERNLCKSIRSIAKIFNCSASTINRILQKNKINSTYKKSRIDRNSLYNLYVLKGLTTLEVADILGVSTYLINRDTKYYEFHRNMSAGTINSYSKGRKNNPNAPHCKRFDVSGFICFGTFEKKYIEQLISSNAQLPIKSKSPVKTEYGIYFPDFEFNDRFVEIKSTYTYDISIGKMKNLNGVFNNNQYQKIKWVGRFIKPVQLLVLDKDGKILKEEWHEKLAIQQGTSQI